MEQLVELAELGRQVLQAELVVQVLVVLVV